MEHRVRRPLSLPARNIKLYMCIHMMHPFTIIIFVFGSGRTERVVYAYHVLRFCGCASGIAVLSFI